MGWPRPRLKQADRQPLATHGNGSRTHGKGGLSSEVDEHQVVEDTRHRVTAGPDGADPPARSVALAPHRHNERALLRRAAGQRPGHTHQEPLRLGRSPDSIAVPRSRPVLDHPQDPHASPSRACRIATGTRRGPRSTRAGASILSIRTYDQVAGTSMTYIERQRRSVA